MGCLQGGDLRGCTCQGLLHRNAQRFRGGLVFKAHRLCVSLNSRLESNNEEEEVGAGGPSRMRMPGSGGVPFGPFLSHAHTFSQSLTQSLSHTHKHTHSLTHSLSHTRGVPFGPFLSGGTAVQASYLSVPVSGLGSALYAPKLADLHACQLENRRSTRVRQS